MSHNAGITKHDTPTLIIILGPTAAGKTSVAIEIAKYFNTEIISCDSRQFYRELKIGSAMPSDEELHEVTHHFIGHLSIHDYYNVSRFEKDALNKITELFSHHSYVIMCGGSGLYIDAVCNGIDELPDPDEKTRTDLQNLLAEKGIGALQAMLFEKDRDYYNQVDLNNPSRLVRALEVCIATGKPYSSFRLKNKQQRPFNIIKIGLDLPKEILHERIEKRTLGMIKKGLEKEALGLYPFRSINALKTVGYTEFFELFEKHVSLEETINKIKTNTRRYAKRQLTWFRRDPQIHWADPINIDAIIKWINQKA
jgi:tRNA dimethylallyltransferase